MHHLELTGDIIDAAAEVRKHMGPGLLESAYEGALFDEIRSRGLTVERQVQLPLRYRGRCLDANLRLDLVVEGLVIVELKAIPAILDIHLAQAQTYLMMTRLPICLIINFNALRLRTTGIRRVVPPKRFYY